MAATHSGASSRSGTVGFTPTREQFDRFMAVIGKADRRAGADTAVRIVAAMFLAGLSWLVAAVGRDEARRIFSAYGEDFFRNLDRQSGQ